MAKAKTTETDANDGIKPFDVALATTATVTTEKPPQEPEKPPVETAEKPGIPSYRYKVSVPHGPSWVVAVKREDEGAAWNEFKAQTGLVRTEHEPEITRVADDTPLGRVS